MARAVGRSILAGYYRLARLGILTPLRVRINLVAKEFVASQNQTYPCVLILSRFAEGQSNPCSVNSREAFPSVQSLKRPW